MRLSIDAWLERTEPRIRLIDAETGLEILHLGPAQVEELMNSGDICLHDMDDSTALCSALFSLLEQQTTDRLATNRHRNHSPKQTGAIDDQTVGNVLH